MSDLEINKSFADTPNFKFSCPSCKSGFIVPEKETFRSLEPDYSSKAHDFEAWDPDWITYRFSVTCKCSNPDCGEVSFACGDGSVDERYGYDGQSEYYECFNIRSFYPSPDLCYIPPDVPVSVESLLKKSFQLFWIDLGSASNSLRASLEALLDELKVPSSEITKKGATTRMSLHRRLEVWASTNKEFAELGLALKEVGNLGSHGDTVRPSHFFGALQIYEHILKQLFENNALAMKALAQKIRAEIKGRP